MDRRDRDRYTVQSQRGGTVNKRNGGQSNKLREEKETREEGNEGTMEERGRERQNELDGLFTL